MRKPRSELIDCKNRAHMNPIPTTRGIIHYSRHGAHVVPAQPKTKRGK